MVTHQNEDAGKQQRGPLTAGTDAEEFYAVEHLTGCLAFLGSHTQLWLNS